MKDLIQRFSDKALNNDRHEETDLDYQEETEEFVQFWEPYMNIMVSG